MDDYNQYSDNDLFNILEIIELLKEENEKTVDELLEKLRRVAQDQHHKPPDGMKNQELKGEINSFKKTPFFKRTAH